VFAAKNHLCYITVQSKSESISARYMPDLIPGIKTPLFIYTPLEKSGNMLIDPGSDVVQNLKRISEPVWIMEQYCYKAQKSYKAVRLQAR
jgi:hypothetical protein